MNMCAKHVYEYHTATSCCCATPCLGSTVNDAACVNKQTTLHKCAVRKALGHPSSRDKRDSHTRIILKTTPLIRPARRIVLLDQRCSATRTRTDEPRCSEPVSGGLRGCLSCRPLKHKLETAYSHHQNSVLSQYRICEKTLLASVLVPNTPSNQPISQWDIARATSSAILTRL